MKKLIIDDVACQHFFCCCKKNEHMIYFSLALITYLYFDFKGNEIYFRYEINSPRTRYPFGQPYEVIIPLKL